MIARFSFPRIRVLAGWAVCALAALASSRGEDDAGVDVASSYPIERYAGMLEKSPFEQVAPLQETAPADDLGADYAITSHYRIGGVLYVNLLERSSQRRIMASSEEKPEAGIKVLSLIDNANPWLVKAVIEKEGRKGTVGFDAPKFPQPIVQASGTASVASGDPVHRTRVRSPQDD